MTGAPCRAPLFRADKKHIHHRCSVAFRTGQAVLVLYGLCVVLGPLALLLTYPPARGRRHPGGAGVFHSSRCCTSASTVPPEQRPEPPWRAAFGLAIACATLPPSRMSGPTCRGDRWFDAKCAA